MHCGWREQRLRGVSAPQRPHEGSGGLSPSDAGLWRSQIFFRLDEESFLLTQSHAFSWRASPFCLKGSSQWWEPGWNRFFDFLLPRPVPVSAVPAPWLLASGTEPRCSYLSLRSAVLPSCLLSRDVLQSNPSDPLLRRSCLLAQFERPRVLHSPNAHFYGHFPLSYRCNVFSYFSENSHH